MDPGRLLLLDTNVLVHLLRAKAAGRWLDETYDLAGRRKHLLSVISLGELLRLAEKWSWGPGRRDRILELSSAFIIVDINRQEIFESYARIGVYWERLGKRMEQNDLWIAATADVAKATLVTTDDGLKKLDRFVEVEWVDPELLKRIGRKE